MKTLAAAVLAAFAPLCIAQVAAASLTYKEARQYTDAVQRVIADTGLWYQKPMPARMQAIKEAAELAKRADRAFAPFGPYHQCRVMATSLYEYVAGLNDFASFSEGNRRLAAHELVLSMRTAYWLGEGYRGCRDAIDKLDPPKKNGSL